MVIYSQTGAESGKSKNTGAVFGRIGVFLSELVGKRGLK
jgi:hypothetical protein